MLAELPTRVRRASRSSAPAWAATTRRRSTRPPSARSSRASTRRTTRPSSRSSRRRSASALRRRRDARRRRPDRRLAEREARHPASSRSRIAVADGPDDGRRRLRLRLRLRHGRGVDGDARARARCLNGEPLGGGRPKDEIEILAFEATLTPRSPRRPRPSSTSPTACGSWARSRSRSAISRPAASTPSARSSRPAAVDIAAAQLLVRERGLAIDLPDAPPFEPAPLDLEGRSRVVAAGTPELCRRSPTRSCAEAGPHRLLRLELRALARAVLRRDCPRALARALRELLRHGRGEHHLLPPARRRRLARWVEETPAGLRLRGEGEPLSHAHQAADRSRRGLERYYERIEPLVRSPKLGPGALAAARELQARRRAARRRARRAAAGPALLRVPSCELVRPEPSTTLLRTHRAALVIGDRPEGPFQSHELTADWTFVRFHYGSRGRRGNYSERELEEWAQRFEDWRA